MPTPPPESDPPSPPSTAEDSDADVLMGNSITGLLAGLTQRSTWNSHKTTWESPDDEELNRLFPAYQIECTLGRGGMGIVYKAHDTVLRKTVAIKLLPPLLAEDAQLMARFKREAQIMNSLDHPGIVKVYSFVQTPDGHAYFVMDYVEGKTIHELVQAKEISVRKTLRLIVQVCKALHYLHGKGILHRDIKPSNIIVDQAGDARLLDFGIAGQVEKGAENLTLTGHNPGTPFYMAPELHKGDPPTTSSDIYALGVTFYEMLTGERPHIQAPPPSTRSKADSSVDKVVFRALKTKPEARYQDADQMRRDIQRCSRASREFRQAIVIAASIIGITAVAMVFLLQPKDAGKTPVPPQAAETMFEPQPAQPEETPLQPIVPDAAVIAPATLDAARQPKAALNTQVIKPAFINSLGMKFVAVPGTHVLFSIWETRVRDYAGFSGKRKPSVIWKTAQGGNVIVPQNDDDPVVVVNRKSANAYCEWLTQKETKEGTISNGARYRLPTDLEWSAAAGLGNEEGATPKERSEKGAASYPWRGVFPPDSPVGNYCDATYAKEILTEPKTPISNYDDGFATIAPVGSFPPNALGIYDLGGNVGEWCADDYDINDKRCVIRGGTYFDAVPETLRGSHRTPWRWETSSWVWLGFRCVLDLSGSHDEPPKAPAPIPAPVVPSPSLPYTTSFESPEFNAGALGTGKALETQSSRWSLHAEREGVDLPQLARVQTAMVKSGKQALLIQAEYAKSVKAGVSTFFENSATILVIEADIRLAGSATQTVWQFAAGDESASGGFVGGVNIAADNGRFQLITPGFKQTAPVMKRDTWYRLRLSFDLSQQSYQVFVNDSAVASDVPFLVRSEKLRVFQFDNFSKGDDLAYLDNFSITEGAVRTITSINPTTSSSALESFRTVLQGYGWSYEDSRYSGSNEQPPSPMFFHPNGKFHEKWKWNYWIAEPGLIHVQFWEPVYKPETAMALKFNDARTAYAGSFKDSKGKVHKITGTRLDPIK